VRSGTAGNESGSDMFLVHPRLRLPRRRYPLHEQPGRLHRRAMPQSDASRFHWKTPGFYGKDDPIDGGPSIQENHEESDAHHLLVCGCWLSAVTNGWLIIHGLRRKSCAKKLPTAWPEMEERHRLVFETHEEGKLTFEEYLGWVVLYQKRSFTRAQFRRFMFAQ